MKTDPKQLRALRTRMTGLSGDAEVNLPVSFVEGLAADCQEAEEARAELDRLKARFADRDIGGEEFIGEGR